MPPTPTGRLRGNDLILTRQFRAPIEDVWTSVTDPESTARWFGRWEGEPRGDSKIRVQMAFEKGEPWLDATIEACEAPHRYVVITSYGPWRLEVRLRQAGDFTELELVHHAIDLEGIGEVGPGWEYYLDNLVAARAGQPLPTFEMYYPGQKAQYLALAGAAAP